MASVCPSDAVPQEKSPGEHEDLRDLTWSSQSFAFRVGISNRWGFSSRPFANCRLSLEPTRFQLTQ